jgi:hypothetical protein
MNKYVKIYAMTETIWSPYESGGMTDEVFQGDTIEKTMRLAVPSETASRLATNLEDYVNALGDESLPIPEVTDIKVISSEQGFHVRHTVAYCEGPNLCALEGDEKMRAVRHALGRIADMQTFEYGKLVVPIDAKATNLHVNPVNGVTLVDVFPPLARHSDGTFPMENVPQGNSSLRRKIMPYMSGTREGAMLRLLTTVLSDGAKPLRQARQIIAPTNDWCYDVLPSNLDNQTKETLHRAIRTRFAGQWVRATTSGAMHQLRNKAGLPPYAE